MVSDVQALFLATGIGAFFYWLLLDPRGDRHYFGFKWDDEKRTVHLGFLVSIMTGLLFGALGVAFFNYLSDLSTRELIVYGGAFAFFAPYVMIRFFEIFYDVLRYFTLAGAWAKLKIFGKKTKERGKELSEEARAKLLGEIKNLGLEDEVLKLATVGVGGKEQQTEQQLVQEAQKQRALAEYAGDKTRFEAVLYKMAAHKKPFDAYMAQRIIEMLPDIGAAQLEVDNLVEKVLVLAKQKQLLEGTDIVIMRGIIEGVTKEALYWREEYRKLTSPKRRLFYKMAGVIGSVGGFIIGSITGWI